MYVDKKQYFVKSIVVPVVLNQVVDENIQQLLAITTKKEKPKLYNLRKV